jgi:hypothetical protein
MTWIAFRAASGRHSRDEETGQSLLGVGQRQEGIRHWRRAEPFMADQLEFTATKRGGAGAVGAHVRAALHFGHRHGSGGPSLSCAGMKR